jgi:hypothetical protein
MLTHVEELHMAMCATNNPHVYAALNLYSSSLKQKLEMRMAIKGQAMNAIVAAAATESGLSSF